uniref:Uncharacterized protein n=1 Tax=Arundo donax TaxID=35708 RepID=A0A0A8YEU6_ARUDO
MVRGGPPGLQSSVR